MSDDLFDKYISSNSELCSNCFSRCYETEEWDKSQLRKSLRGVVGDDVNKTKFAKTQYDQTYSASKSRTVGCSNCGSDRECLNRPASKEKTLEYGDNLSEVANEIDGLEINPNALRGELRRFKKDDTRQYEDNTNFAEAFNRTVAVK